ncbi:Extracellular ligand-binding receptor [Gloeothece citriformis PCC 7424]|uniref:Extracellular ligand-binding receptor n=1 Tax=Gloeothece citriformis (strain PCC 7424) TaxID=65393 RepID=B7KI35_GLOC7|nr:ABC transporter substrate-binding protein [Gloeothece citriformis]ACK73522.1 Extracellular ligand-binding receptor [Gloeothece citriformis PCC 7424]
MSWICDGVPKDGKDYPQAIPGGHTPYENHGPDCNICGLPQEAMSGGKGGGFGGGGGKTQTTVVSAPTTIARKKQSQWLIPAIGVASVLILVGGGFGLYKVLFSQSENNEPDPVPTITVTPGTAGGLISSNAQNGQYISQGEKILLDATPDKQDGATAFGGQDWDGAISAYQQAANSDPNDPEAKIYLNNAQAQKSGNPLTIAVVVPIKSDPNSAKEVLRGVAKAQEEYNQNPQGSLLQVVIADDPGGLDSKAIAEDLVNASEVVGVIGHGIDPFSEQAIKEYETAELAILSPRTTSVTDGSQPTLKTIGMDQKTDELLGSYLQGVGKTLTEYAANTNPSPKSVIIYNSESPYSQRLKDEIVNALPQVQGQMLKEFDVKSAIDPTTVISEATGGGAKVAFIALNKGKVDDAIALAQANADAGFPLLLLGGDELYSPEILSGGGDAVKGIVLAVPWTFQPNDPFARDAIKSWKGRVSWRTATAYDATQVLAQAASENSDRSGVSSALAQGVPLNSANTNFSIFDEVPLVEAKLGTGGPPGSSYVFSPVQ